MESSEQRNNMLPVIGGFKLAKAALLFFVAVGLHRLLRPDQAEVVARWVRVIRVDPDNLIFHDIAAKLTGLSHRRLEELSAGTFFYSALFAVEGTGLILRKRWAEYFTTISTTAFLPLEVYELTHKPSAVKAAVLVINLAIVAYLVWMILKNRRSAKS